MTLTYEKHERKYFNDLKSKLEDVFEDYDYELTKSATVGYFTVSFYSDKLLQKYKETTP